MSSVRLHRKPRVLVVSAIPPPFSGPEVMTAQLLASPLKELCELHHFNISKGRDVETKARFDLMNILYGLLQPFQLLGYMIHIRPDIVYTNLAQNLGGFLRYASFIWIISLFRTPIIVRVMGDGFNHFYRRSSLPLRLLIRTTLRHIDRYILRSNALKRQFDGVAPAEKLRIVYSGIDTADFHLTRSRDTDGQIRVLFVGYLTQAKGALDLLKAVPVIVAHNPAVHFQLMGAQLDIERNITYIANPASNQASLESLMANTEARNHVRLLGTQAGREKIESFVNADIFILPSYSEAFPTVVLEAMAAGLPVVATRVGALPEVFDERNILFIDPGNIQQLSEAIICLAMDPGLRSTMGVYNRQDVNNRFNLKTHADSMYKVFAEVLQKNVI